MTREAGSPAPTPVESQSAFVRGFIDDEELKDAVRHSVESQSAFVRGFIDDDVPGRQQAGPDHVSIRVRARLHR